MEVKGKPDPQYVDVQQEGDEPVIEFEYSPEELEWRKKLSFSPVTGDVTLYGRDSGVPVRIRVGGLTVDSVLDELVYGIKYAEQNYGLVLPAQSPQGKPKAQQAQSGQVQSGTDVLHKVTIDPDEGKNGRIELMVGNFQYPFKDARGPEAWKQVFAEDSGFTDEHFSVPGIYTPKDWGGTLYVDWQKPDKYYNAVLIHR